MLKKKHENKENLDFAFIIARIVRSLNIWMQLFNRPAIINPPCVRHKVVVTEKKEHAPLYRRKMSAVLDAYDKYEKKSQEHRSIPATFALGACKSLPDQNTCAAAAPQYIASVN